MLSYYKMDLTLNNVSLTEAVPTERSASRLVPVPGGDAGPGGVLVLAEGCVVYHRQGMGTQLRVDLPRREATFGRAASASTYASASSATTTARKSYIVAHASIVQREQRVFFCLLQSEEGDLFKVELVPANDDVGTVAEIRLKYFDTVPVAKSLCISRNGLLFLASEFGDHVLYRIVGDGSGDPIPGGSASSADAAAIDTAAQIRPSKKARGSAAVSSSSSAPTSGFTPGVLQNLEPVSGLDSLAAILDLHAADLCKEGNPQLYALCGRGSRASLRVLRYGLPVDDFTKGAMLPGTPSRVWAIRSTLDAAHDSFIVVSFRDATLVLSVGEQIREVKDSGFSLSRSTLEVVTLAGAAGHAQIHREGIFMVLPGGKKREWPTPAGKRVVCASANERQIVVALEGGTVVYFELGDGDRTMNEAGRCELGSEVSCIDIGAIPHGRQRSFFVAVGSEDSYVRVLSLAPDRLLEDLGLQALQQVPHSVCQVEMSGGGGSGGGGGAARLYLCIGLKNGIMVRTQLDWVSGKMSRLRTRFLGVGRVGVFRVKVAGKWAAVACASQTWLFYEYAGNPLLTPLSLSSAGDAGAGGGSPCSSASGFSSGPCPEGIVASAGESLRIFSAEELGTIFNQQAVALRYTPREMSVHRASQCLAIVESDHDVLPARDRAQIASQDAVAYVPALAVHEEEDEGLGVTTQQVGYARPSASPASTSSSAAGGGGGGGGGAGAYAAAPTSWASCLRVVRPQSGETLDLVEMDNGEAAFCVTTVVFRDRGEEEFIVVGTARHMRLHPTRHRGGRLRVYRLVSGKKLQLVHVTDVDDVPLALKEFDQQLVVGMGRVLRLYAMGKKRLLRKCENRSLPNMIRSINVHGNRVVVGDMQQSFFFLEYRREQNELALFADDTTPRYVTCATLLDYDTVAGADKFGNVFVLRLPETATADDAVSGVRTAAGSSFAASSSSQQALWEANPLRGAPHKVMSLVQFHIGEVATSLQKTAIVAGGTEVLLYGTVMGAVGAMVPFVTRRDVDFFRQLERQMRSVCGTLSGWDHLAYRSYYIPVKEAVDGDLCELFGTLTADQQKEIAGSLDRDPDEVLKKIDDMRQQCM